MKLNSDEIKQILFETEVNISGIKVSINGVEIPNAHPMLGHALLSMDSVKAELEGKQEEIETLEEEKEELENAISEFISDTKDELKEINVTLVDIMDGLDDDTDIGMTKSYAVSKLDYVSTKIQNYIDKLSKMWY